MSVKFESREQVRANLPQGKQDLAHEVGNAITRGGGAQGYLAVRLRKSAARDSMLICAIPGLSQAATKQSSAHQDAHVRISRGTSRAARFLDRKGQEQERQLLHLACS